MEHTKKIVYIAILVAQAVVIGLVEGMLPAVFPFAPGAKIGLANLITLLAIFTLRKRDVSLFISVRLLVQMLLGGTMSTFLYSAAGAILSFIMMEVVKSLGPKRVSVVGISAVGGFFHNVGQLLVACLIAKTWTVILYLPVLSIMGILAGLAIGIAGNYLLTHVSSLYRAHLTTMGHAHSAWLETGKS
ncbi:MAG: Gx transporter family protein [Lactobacillales bacterium]|jgi:heptaprenyl diphosphate synthase|nr:Gx transporter family protein [Lactobacillales bacterium]